jgi:hypothetical protein
MLRCELDVMEYAITMETELLEEFDEVDLDEVDEDEEF